VTVRGHLRGWRAPNTHWEAPRYILASSTVIPLAAFVDMVAGSDCRHDITVSKVSVVELWLALSCGPIDAPEGDEFSPLGRVPLLGTGPCHSHQIWSADISPTDTKMVDWPTRHPHANHGSQATSPRCTTYLRPSLILPSMTLARLVTIYGNGALPSLRPTRRVWLPYKVMALSRCGDRSGEFGYHIW